MSNPVIMLDVLEPELFKKNWPIPLSTVVSLGTGGDLDPGTYERTYEADGIEYLTVTLEIGSNDG